MASFRVGEIAIIVKSNAYPELVGKECEILSALDVDDTYMIDIPGFPTSDPYWAHYSKLRKRHEPGNWEDEEFKKTLEFLDWNPMITAGEG